MASDNLSRELKSWDGIHMEPLSSLYNAAEDKNDLIRQVIDVLLSDLSLETATTWLIKHHIDQKNNLDNDQWSAVLGIFDQLNHWEAQLHVLQILPKAHLDSSSAATLEFSVGKLLNAENKFVKAAAYEAYDFLCNYLTQYLSSFVERCHQALEFESASVKVKIRRILKKRG